jgi:four helix bundle protein
MVEYKFGFEKLEVWQLSRELSVQLYKRTITFPQEERFGLISQIRRCVLSVSSNIAEGSGRSTSKDQAHFTTLAYGSLMELFNQLIICKDLQFISDQELAELKEMIQKLSIKLSNLKKTQLNRNK